MRHCRHCGLDRPDTDFYPSLPSKCKECKKSQQQKLRSRTAPTRALYWRNYRAENPERVAAIQKRHYEANKERWHRKQALRTARKRGGNQVFYTRGQIFVRDGFRCKLCGRPVDMALRHPHPMSATLDHKLPLWLGGADAPWNVRTAHLVCNLRKGKRVGEASNQRSTEPP